MYAFMYSKVIDPMLRFVRVYLPKFSEMKAGDRVLDVCCGTGDQAFHFARKGLICTGIDLDHRLIEFADKSGRRQGLWNVSFQRASALDLPFKDNTFDCATITLALHEKGRAARDSIISEMKRVVKTEGVLVFVDYRAPYPKDAYSYFAKAIEFMAGRDHFRCFQDFIKQGGLEGLLAENQLQEDKKVYIKKGPLAVIKTCNL